jgi:predicted nuclease of restriction endonuclease-like (RecB) superfamily
MSEDLQYTLLYKNWLDEIKLKIHTSRTKIALVANVELTLFYWELGKTIVEKQKETEWGNKILEVLAKDLKSEFPDSTGFSRSNLYNCLQFYTFYSDSLIVQRSVGQLENAVNSFDLEFVQRSVAQIPWRHNVRIVSKASSVSEALFYINKTIENGWSSDVLALQIKSDLYSRSGKSINNFSSTLPNPTSELVEQTLKDPYFLDFITIAPKANERDIELQLVQHISHFLLELGKGFAFIGRQYCLELGQKEYFIDLLFYHVVLKCYVVVELKNKDFEPEFAGKLNFYLTLVDKTLKNEDDKPTIGILLCRGKDNLEVEYALQDINKPIGVSEFNLDKILPKGLKSKLPTVEEFEQEFKNLIEPEQGTNDVF